jgi:hypothetical protein
MTAEQDALRVVSACCEIAAEPGRVFELIADRLRSRAGTAATTWLGYRPGSACAAPVVCSR